jgi:hypothetical protein
VNHLAELGFIGLTCEPPTDLPFFTNAHSADAKPEGLFKPWVSDTVWHTSILKAVEIRLALEVARTMPKDKCDSPNNSPPWALISANRTTRCTHEKHNCSPNSLEVVDRRLAGATARAKQLVNTSENGTLTRLPKISVTNAAAHLPCFWTDSPTTCKLDTTISTEFSPRTATVNCSMPAILKKTASMSFAAAARFSAVAYLSRRVAKWARTNKNANELKLNSWPSQQYSARSKETPVCLAMAAKDFAERRM